jgi:hypothetical protein
VNARSPLVGLVLAAFVAATAVPGPQVVAHRHARGDHPHVHGHAAADHPHPHGHAAAHRAHAAGARLPVHGDGIAASDGELGDHVHVVGPFQPATAAAVVDVVHRDVVASLDAVAPAAPVARAGRRERSRAPPASAHV